MAGDRLGDHRFDIVFRAGIGDHRLGGAALLPCLFGRVMNGLGAIDGDQLRALGGEQQRCGAADAARRAGDDDGFAFEAPHERILRSLFSYRDAE